MFHSYSLPSTMATILAVLVCGAMPAPAQQDSVFSAVQQPGFPLTQDTRLALEARRGESQDDDSLIELLASDQPIAEVQTQESSPPLPTAAAGPAPATVPAPMEMEGTAEAYCPGDGCQTCSGVAGPHRAQCLCGTCDMGPHYPYDPPMHGHYYFRPYSYQGLIAQRNLSPLIGEDPRNPYANRVFAQVYRIYEERHRAGVGPNAPGEFVPPGVAPIPAAPPAPLPPPAASR